MTSPADRLVGLLDLERIDLNIFRGRSPDESLQRVFGGQVAGQALIAAGRTTDGDRPVHSLHAYFLRPGRPGVPIVYQVERVRDGRSFTTRRVVAVQQGRTIFNLTASFHEPEPGFEHQVPMPRVPDPEQLPPAGRRDPRSPRGAAHRTAAHGAPDGLRHPLRGPAALDGGRAAARGAAQRRVDACGGSARRRPARAHLRPHLRQ
ncbi:hypothetical protein GCM10020000_10090 [Streptomyces olivoverticillatus]